MLMELCLNFNFHKYLRNVYYLLLDKKKDYFHSILIKKNII